MTDELREPVLKALRNLADAREGLGHLTCSEIQGTIELALAVGREGLAVEIVMGHALGDDDGADLHHEIYLASKNKGDAAETLAQQWVADLKAGFPLHRFRAFLSDGTSREFATREERDYVCQSWYVRDRGLTVALESWARDSGWILDRVISPEDSLTDPAN